MVLTVAFPVSFHPIRREGRAPDRALGHAAIGHIDLRHPTLYRRLPWTMRPARG